MLLALCLVLEKITVYRPKNNCPVRYCNSVSFHGFMTFKKKKKKTMTLTKKHVYNTRAIMLLGIHFLKQLYMISIHQKLNPRRERTA